MRVHSATSGKLLKNRHNAVGSVLNEFVDHNEAEDIAWKGRRESHRQEQADHRTILTDDLLKP